MDFNSISREVLDVMTEQLSRHFEEQLAMEEGTKLSDIENVMRGAVKVCKGNWIGQDRPLGV